MNFVLFLAYAILGVVLAIPYCWLAGWNSENFVMVAFVAPAFLFLWLMFASFAGIFGITGSKFFFNLRAAFVRAERSRVPGSLAVFWWWTAYSFLPITFHWSAKVVNAIGYREAASWIDKQRYLSPLYTLLAVMILLIIIATVEDLRNRLKNRLKKVST